MMVGYNKVPLGLYQLFYLTYILYELEELRCYFRIPLKFTFWKGNYQEGYSLWALADLLMSWKGMLWISEGFWLEYEALHMPTAVSATHTYY